MVKICSGKTNKLTNGLKGRELGTRNTVRSSSFCSSKGGRGGKGVRVDSRTEERRRDKKFKPQTAETAPLAERSSALCKPFHLPMTLVLLWIVNML